MMAVHIHKPTIFARRIFWLMITAAFLIFFAHTRSFLLLFDGLTYTALAKNILRTGDWKTLHYGLEQYPDFYQHPPLAIWMQAVVMKCLGTAEWVTRILPSLAGVLTVGAVFKFTEKKMGLTAAFWAALCLLTSTRFIKWGSNFYLDGIFGFFCFASFSLWILAIRTSTQEVNLAGKITHPENREILDRRPFDLWQHSKHGFWLSVLAGFFLSCAFMTKGVIASAVAAGMCISFFFSLYFPLRIRLLVCCAGALFGTIFPLVFWFKYGEGAFYLEQYFLSSVRDRVGIQFILGPWENIWKIWWPWWPVLLVSVIAVIREFRIRNFTPAIVLVVAILFPIGFSLGSSYLEHYLTPFYPFAAVVVGFQISRVRFFHLNENSVKVLGFAVSIIAVFLATVSPDVNAQKSTPAMSWIQEVRTLPLDQQSEIKNVLFTEKSGDLWISLATILGRTEWQSIGAFSSVRVALPRSILIAKAGESVAQSWKPVSCLYTPGVNYYASADLMLCPSDR